MRQIDLISFILATALAMSACGGGSSAPATPAAPASSAVTGTFAAPVGTRVVLQNKLGDDLDVTVHPHAGGAFVYNEQTFRSATTLPAGTATA